MLLGGGLRHPQTTQFVVRALRDPARGDFRSWSWRFYDGFRVKIKMCWRGKDSITRSR